MTNPYQPTRFADEGFNDRAQEVSRFSTYMGIVAAILATPLTSLFMIAAALVLIRLAGQFLNLESFAEDPRFHVRATVWGGGAALITGLSAYFAIRSATHYFVNDRQQGWLFLVASLLISSVILVVVCVILLCSVMLHNAMQDM